MRDICHCHQACGPEPRVAISPALNIDEVLRSGEQCALTELVRRGWLGHIMLQPVQQVLHYPGRDTGLLGRADKAKEDDLKVARKLRGSPCEPHQTWLSRPQAAARACRSSSL